MTAIPPHHDPACWGCGDNPTGLHLPLPAAEGLTEYEAYFAFDEQHQGGPGIVHGGLVAGALAGAAIYLGLLTIPLRYLFGVTSWLILLLAAGMASQAVQFLNNAGTVVVLDRTVWNTSWILSEGSLFGKLLHTLIGYTERPTEMQLITYIATLLAMFLLMRIARPAPRPRVVAAAE